MCAFHLLLSGLCRNMDCYDRSIVAYGYHSKSASNVQTKLKKNRTKINKKKKIKSKILFKSEGIEIQSKNKTK